MDRHQTWERARFAPVPPRRPGVPTVERAGWTGRAERTAHASQGEHNGRGGRGGDWARYWRSADEPLEAMYAHFRRHVYHRHSHESYSFGLTEAGNQGFTCRGARHTSAAGMLLAFNPDEPHDGHPNDGAGFTYRMIHVGVDLMGDILNDGILADGADRTPGLPLFPRPVVAAPRAAARLRALHAALLGGASRLRRDELLRAAIAAVVREGAARRVSTGDRYLAVPGIARRAREVIADRYLEDISAADLAAATGASRFAVYRSFQAAYGLAPSDYQRDLRLRRARRLIAEGMPIAEAAAATGFADQSHLTRWFVRCFGVTPRVYQTAI
ncbi:AraC family transcriptional regulator [Thermopolyspora sp. NPDC052614]|uniref:AraC family transcriptional regulator n=1 Tax=Thermopolyspora sp. NPDC052614 TaxID=3155682 RepID=UPI00343F282D